MKLELQAGTVHFDLILILSEKELYKLLAGISIVTPYTRLDGYTVKVCVQPEDKKGGD